MNNVKTIISNHNKAQINKSDPTNDRNCNCRNSRTCPMDGKCNDQNIIYQAEATTPTSSETYIGLCDTSFKLRYRNHVCSFRNEWYKQATEVNIFGALKIRILCTTSNGVRLNTPDHILIQARDVICVYGKNILLFLNPKCQH